MLAVLARIIVCLMLLVVTFLLFWILVDFADCLLGEELARITLTLGEELDRMTLAFGEELVLMTLMEGDVRARVLYRMTWDFEGESRLWRRSLLNAAAEDTGT